MSKIITNVMPKGGVGKTTVLMNIGYELSLLKKKVLFIDTDGQLNLTSNIQYKNDQVIAPKNIFDLFTEEDPKLDDYIYETSYKNIDIIQGSSDLYFLRNERNFMAEDKDFIPKFFDMLHKSDYDYVLIDTNPTISELNLALIQNTDLNLIIIDGDINAVDTLQTLLGQYIKSYPIWAKGEITQESIIYSFATRNKILFNNIAKQESVIEYTRNTIIDMFHESMILDTVIHRSVVAKYAKMDREPISQYDKKHTMSKEFRKLAKEVE